MIDAWLAMFTTNVDIFPRQILKKPLSAEKVMQTFRTVRCGVDMRAGNICYKAEQKWPSTMFRKRKLSDLTSDEKEKLYRNLEKHGTKIYDDCVDVERVKRRCKKIRDEILAPFYEEHVLEWRYNAVMNPPIDSNISTASSSASFGSDETVINTGATPQLPNTPSQETPPRYVLCFMQLSCVCVCDFAGIGSANVSFFLQRSD